MHISLGLSHVGHISEVSILKVYRDTLTMVSSRVYNIL